MKRRLILTLWALALVAGLGYAGQQDMQAELAYYERIGNAG